MTFRGVHRSICSSGVVYGQQAVFNWGVGTDGQLGHKKIKIEEGGGVGWWVANQENPQYIQRTPRRLVKSKHFETLAIGSKFTLAVNSTGDLYGWGKGFAGEKSSSKEPVLIMPASVLGEGKRFIEVACGPKHCAAIDSEGAVLTWGFGGGSQFYQGAGQLGHGDAVSVDTPKYVKALEEYGAKIKQVVCCGSHTLFLTTDGEILSCGVGEYGRLGTGNTGSALVPEPLESLVDETIVAIAGGHAHSIALTEEGKMYSWGRNSHGQLGHFQTFIDPTANVTLPLEVEIQAEEGKDPVFVQSIAAAGSTSVAVSADGGLYSWGHLNTHYPFKTDPRLFGDNHNKVVDAKCAAVTETAACILAKTEDNRLWSLGQEKLQKNFGLLGSGKKGRMGRSPKQVCLYIYMYLVCVTYAYFGQPQ